MAAVSLQARTPKAQDSSEPKSPPVESDQKALPQEPSSPPPPPLPQRKAPPISITPPLAIVGSDKNALNLQECFRLAAIRSDTLQINEQSIRAARARLSQAIAEIFPTINLVSSHNFQNVKTISSSSSSTSTSKTTSRWQTTYSNSTDLTLSQTLFNGFSNYNAVGAAQADVESQRFNLQRSYQVLYQSVAQSFYQILSNEGDLVILGDSIKTLEARVKELEGRVRIARSRPSELLQAQADLASQKVNIEQTKGLLAAARELMAFFLGIPSDKIKLRETQKFPTSGSLEKYLAVTGARPDILALVESERQARRNLSSAKGALFPEISATGSYTLNQNPDPITQQWAVNFQIQLPLFDGGLILNRIQEQKALVQQSELNVENIRRTADQDLRTAYANFNSSAAQVVRLQEEVEMSSLNYDALADDYKKGVASNLDVLIALNNLQNARRTLNSADLNARFNLIQLHVASGMAAVALPNQSPAAAKHGHAQPHDHE